MGACLTGKKEKPDEANASSPQELKKQVNSKIVSGGILQPKKEFSWDKRRKENAANQDKAKEKYMAKDLDNETFSRKHGEINGQQFVIDNCKKSQIILLDHISAMFIDDCSHSQIVIGPVSSSIFLRTSHNCRLTIACGQLRLRDCSDVSISLFCSSEPVIESCKNITFTCNTLNYSLFPDHFASAGLDIWNNKWSRIYDFTKRHDGKLNYALKDIPMGCLSTDEALTGVQNTDLVRRISSQQQNSELLTAFKRVSRLESRDKVNGSPMKSLNYMEERSVSDPSSMQKIKAKFSAKLNQTSQRIDISIDDSQDFEQQVVEQEGYEWTIPHTSGLLPKNANSFFLLFIFNPVIEMAVELYDRVRKQAFSQSVKLWLEQTKHVFIDQVQAEQLYSQDPELPKEITGKSKKYQEFVVWKVAGTSKIGNFNSLLQVIDFYLAEMGADTASYYFNNDFDSAHAQSHLIFEEWEERGKAIH